MSLRNTLLHFLQAKTISVVFFSTWSDISLWQSEQSNHFLQHGALIAACTFSMCLHIQIDYKKHNAQAHFSLPSGPHRLLYKLKNQSGSIGIINIFNFMGQDQPVNSPRKKNGSISNPSKTKMDNIFARDPRLVEQILFLPELFAGSMNSHINKVARLIQTVPLHELQVHIIDGINERFMQIKDKPQPNKQTEAKMENKLKNKRSLTQSINLNEILEEEQNKHYYQLQTFQRFFDLLKNLQHWFYIEKSLANGMKLKKPDKKSTIRKKILPTYDSILNKHLFAKIFLKYYIVLLKRNFGSKDKQKKSFVMDFHESIGKMICQMIEFDHLTDKKLMHLAYKVVYIEHTKSNEKLKSILIGIKQQFQPIYLTKEHSLILKASQFERIRQVARCYLDELYLKSLKEAEDPDIIIDANEGFGLVKNFPIMRVRQDKNR